MDSTKRNNADPCSRDNKSRRGETLSNRNNIAQEPLENTQEDIRSLVPANIRHKYGSSVVTKLISPEQVRSCLREQEGTRYTQKYHVPRLTMKSGTREDSQYNAYDELGQWLRSNLFPGVSIKQHSLMQDSYTAEVNEKGILDKHNTHHWHGKKTDDLAIWSQILMKRNAIDKLLQSRPKLSPNILMPIRKNVSRDVPVLLPPPKEKPKKLRHQTKTKKPDVALSPVTQSRQEDDFWDFYDKPIQ